MMTLSKLSIRAAVFSFAATLPWITSGDDTDIYINNATPDPTSVPQLMFYLDYRPNVLASTLCSNASAASCTQARFFSDPQLGDDDNDPSTPNVPTNPYYLPTDMAAIGTGPFKFFDLLRLSLKAVMRLPEFDRKIKVGFMMSHNQASQGSTVLSDGGAILQGFRLIDSTAAATDGVAGITDILNKLNITGANPNNADHPNQGTEAFFEFYRYLSGRPVSKAHLGFRDFEKGGSSFPVDDSTNMSAYAPASWDTSIETTVAGVPRYISPLVGTSCSKVFTANFTFGDATQDTDSNTLINSAIASNGLSKTGETVVSNSNPWNSIVGYLHGNDIGSNTYLGSDIRGRQNVTSYFFFKGQQQNAMNALAAAGGTQPAIDLSSDDPGVIVNAIVQTLREVLSVSTTFVAASVPVNVFNRAQAINNVYIAIFEANAAGKPTWVGNVKKLKIGTASGISTLVDANATTGGAIGTDGRVKAASRTFWTDASNVANLPADPNSPSDNNAGVDGKNVIMGGAGQKIPGFLTNNTGLSNATSGARQVYYWNGTVPSSGNTAALTALNVDNTTRDALHSALKPGITPTNDTRTEVTNLLRYIRGLNDGTDTVRTVLDTIPTGTRSIPWITGDPLHSRPRPINYGKFNGHTNPDFPAIYIAVGGNDGFMRLIRNTAADGTELGQELWAFMPPEAMSTSRAGVQETQAILKTNASINDPREITRPYHPIGVDGPPVELVIDNNGNGTVEPDSGTGHNDKVFLFFGLRRGGKAIYALDITNPTAPAFKWRAAPAGAGSAFEELSYTFGTPKLGRVSVDGVSTRALFFSGGYDENKDGHVYGTNDSSGRAIFIVNADTGALIWKAVGGATYGSTTTKFTHPGLVDSIASGLTIVDTDGDALIDRIVVGDTGGNVWRADLVGNTRTNWKLSLLAKLGRHGESGATNDRRIFHEPDVVQTKSADGTPYDAVLIGTGDRENPLDKPTGSTPVANRFYMIRDRNIGVGALVDSYAPSSTTIDLADTSSSSPFADVTNYNCEVATTQAECVAASSPSGAGWKLRMAPTGEKVLASPLTISGTVFFTSYLPTTDPTSCEPSEGKGFVYAVGIRNGSTKPKGNEVLTATRVLAGATTDDLPNEAGDDLKSPGIPAEVVYVPGYGVLCPDLTFCSDSSLPRVRSHWLRTKD